MVAERMGSEGDDSSHHEGTKARIQVQTANTKANHLMSQGSFYSLTLDEVQDQLGDLGKPLSSMNLDELLKTVWSADGSNPPPPVGGADYVPVQQYSSQITEGPEGMSSLNRESGLTISRNLSIKTVDEVWQDIQQEMKQSFLDRKTTLGEMTLEDFLVKAGIVAESSQEKINSSSVIGRVDTVGLPPQAQWMNYEVSSSHSQHPQPQSSSMLPVFVQGHSVQQPVPLGVNPIVEGLYPETHHITMSSSPQMASLSETQTIGRKRVAPGDIAEKSVERRQKRMIKNRESAARSRARKQAYTHELENKVSRLEEENERLKRQKEWEKALPNVQPPEPKYQLRRTSSAPV